jgi:uncharacterized GH25 family protein
MKYRKWFVALAALALVSPWAVAHDTWLQLNSAVVRVGDAVYVDLMLGNHGNEHRDFKVAGKFDPSGAKITVVDPDGGRFDLKPSLTDVGYAPKEGFWAGQYTPGKAGLYVISQTSEQVVTYAPERVVRSAKAFFLAAAKLDAVPADAPGFDRVLGDPLEIVPVSSTVCPMGPGVPIKVRLLYKGKPLAGEKVSFIPRGEELRGEVDPTYERKTDDAGVATFEPKAANYYLVAVHHIEPAERGPGYESTKYSSTLTVIVPGVCPCCGG